VNHFNYFQLISKVNSDNDEHLLFTRRIKQLHKRHYLLASLIAIQTNFISIRLLQKFLLKGGRGLNVILFSFTMMVISVCFSWALDH